MTLCSTTVHNSRSIQHLQQVQQGVLAQGLNASGQLAGRFINISQQQPSGTILLLQQRRLHQWLLRWTVVISRVVAVTAGEFAGFIPCRPDNTYCAVCRAVQFWYHLANKPAHLYMLGSTIAERRQTCREVVWSKRSRAVVAEYQVVAERLGLALVGLPMRLGQLGCSPSLYRLTTFETRDKRS